MKCLFEIPEKIRLICDKAPRDLSASACTATNAAKRQPGIRRRSSPLDSSNEPTLRKPTTRPPSRALAVPQQGSSSAVPSHWAPLSSAPWYTAQGASYTT